MKSKTYLITKLAFLVGISFLGTVSHAESPRGEHAAWMTDFEAAKAKAEAEDKAMLVDFTGSDWCIWCIRLKEEVFSEAAFKDYAADNLILVKIDFPRNKEQSDALKAQNQALAKKHGIRGFPTVLIMDAEGNVLERTGYRGGGAGKYVDYLKGILAGEG